MMISNIPTPATQCYVYITLPGQISPVVAGKFIITQSQYGIPLGRFIYGKSYLARLDALPIDPMELKLSSKIYETSNLNGIFGPLRDAGPDYWGRRIIEKYTGKPQLGEIDYLLYSLDDRAGALSFGLTQVPPASQSQFNTLFDLEKLQQIAEAIMQDKALFPHHVHVQELLLAATSMGGARPKAVVEDEKGLWLAKFNCLDDKWNNAKVEHGMLVLAKACNIHVPESRVVQIGNKDVLLVKRFDRDKIAEGYTRARMISALTLLRADEQSREKWSYIFLVEELRRISANPIEDAKELFKRMCFNALISNIDDHPRNHAFIAKNIAWRLSPAYDLTPSVPIGIERRDLAMSCGEEGRFACVHNLLSQSARFLLNAEQAKKIINDMAQYVAQNWYATLRTVGVTEQDCKKLSGAFVYPGFFEP